MRRRPGGRLGRPVLPARARRLPPPVVNHSCDNTSSSVRTVGRGGLGRGGNAAPCRTETEGACRLCFLVQGRLIRSSADRSASHACCVLLRRTEASASASAHEQDLWRKTAGRGGRVLDDELFCSVSQVGCPRPPGKPRLGLWQSGPWPVTLSSSIERMYRELLWSNGHFLTLAMFCGSMWTQTHRYIWEALTA